MVGDDLGGRDTRLACPWRFGRTSGPLVPTLDGIELGSDLDGVGVEAGGHAGFAVVAAAVENREREAAFETPVDDEAVAGGHLFGGQSHLAEAVVLVDIGAGDPDDEVGGEFVEGGREGVGEGSEIIVAGDFAGESDVEVAGFFGAGVIAPAVDRVGEDAVVVAEDGVGAIALVGVGVGDENAEGGMIFVQVTDGHGDVIEHAVAEAAVGESVVGAAGKVGGHAVDEGVMTGGDGGGGFEGGAVEEAGLPGKAEFVDLGGVEGAVGEFAEVIAGVDAEELAGGGGSNGDDFDGSGLGNQEIVGLREFFHGEGMAGWEGEEKLRMIEAAEAWRHEMDDTKVRGKGKPQRAQRGFGMGAGIGHGGMMDWISGELWDRLGEERTDAHRVATGRDGYLDRYGEWLLWSGGRAPRVEVLREDLLGRFGFAARGYLARELVRKASEQKPAELIAGEEPGEIVVQEAGLSYVVEPAGGYSSGLFLDQRANRQWVSGLGARRMLNLFAYTCSFTVCAAAGGAVTCSVDAAKRVLGTGRRNLELNGIDPAEGHRFLADDAMKVVPRLAKRGEKFDLIVLDPPTFGRADGRVFRIEKDLPGLVSECFGLLESGGSLLVSCNYAEWDARNLRDLCEESLRGAGFSMEAGQLPAEIPHGAVSWRLRRTG